MTNLLETNQHQVKFQAKARVESEQERIEREDKVTDVITRIYSYLYFLEMLMENEQHTPESKINNMSVIIDKMSAEINSLDKYYDTIRTFNAIDSKISKSN